MTEETDRMQETDDDIREEMVSEYIEITMGLAL